MTLRLLPPRAPITLCLLALALSLSGCGKPAATAAPAPMEISADTTCSLDGMTLADFPGPKGQIQYVTGTPDFFCDTLELLSVYLKPEQQRQITAIFVQDMAQTDWKAPQGHWIDAKAAFYVAGSKARGSMGGTLASFGTQVQAQAFAAKEGGKVYGFDQITPDIASLDGGVVSDRKM